MTDQSFVLAAPIIETVTVHVGLEPVYNMFNSLLLLASTDERSGFGEWVLQTATKLTRQQMHINGLIQRALFDALVPDRHWATVPAYLDYLAAADPIVLRDRALEGCIEEKDGVEPLDKATLLNDKAAYLDFIERLYAHKAAEKDHAFEPAYYSEAHDLFNDPPALQKLLLDHLRTMWDSYLSAEWTRTLPMLQESVEAFQQLDYSGLNALQAVRVVTGRDLTGVWDGWADQITFIPSAHIGPYVTGFHNPDHKLAYVVFGARLPEGARVMSPALSRSELLVRLSALADDTRLRILELLTQHEELCAQDVIEMLDLSQSAASRHLRQLTATGYLIERRREVSKCYTLNPQRVDDTLRALKRFLRAH